MPIQEHGSWPIKECDKSTLFKRDFNIINANGDALLGPSPQVEVQHALITHVILACGSRLTMSGPFQYSRREILDTQLKNQLCFRMLCNNSCL